ncbi:hypothetical protein JJD41_19415 [Oxynema sp. CENA135]|uniref:hypothetical protein n=1 Tax=Oxynema sp. CENA135 TaxID=984206 RepID=UPI00190CFDD6|nr:hypothetical protein [Oxynema sp. CENA135]MBK4732022.1 hypothetical protein [Oxynema sp. CENA135]
METPTVRQSGSIARDRLAVCGTRGDRSQREPPPLTSPVCKTARSPLAKVQSKRSSSTLSIAEQRI